MIYSIMSYIYLLTIIMYIERLKLLRDSMIFTIISVNTGIVLCAFVCGFVHQKCEQISEVLDRIETNLLSEREYRDWHSFKTICHKTSFGFTIGGFGSLRKTTLIAVIIGCN